MAQKICWIIAKKALVLDLGCGYGRDSKFFVKNSFRTYGVDLSKAMIERAKETVKYAKFFVMNILDLDFLSDYFDVIKPRGYRFTKTIYIIAKKL